MRSKNPNDEDDGALDQQIFKWWIELRDLRTGSVRQLALEETTRIHLARRNETQRPNESVLRVQDGSMILEPISLDDLAAQLRRIYPDETHERTLHSKRDRDAEQRRHQALDDLGRLFARVALDKLIDEHDEQNLDQCPQK